MLETADAPPEAEADIAYFDHNATTPVDPRVRDAMLPWLAGVHGNPSSAHAAGRRAKQAVEAARAQVAAALGGRPEEVIFLSSGTEANNMVIAGLARHHGHRGRLVVNTLEHPSVRNAAAKAGARGMEVVTLRPGADGRIDPADATAALDDATRLLCLMQANNEVGTLQPVAEVSAACRRRGVPVLCDAVQAIGKVAIDVDALGVDYLVLGGHKFHGPLGVAALWVRSGALVEPLMVGAPQEGGRRASTENVPAIVGLGEACALAQRDLETRHAQLLALRQRFEAGLGRIGDAVVHCADSQRLPHTSHVAFLGVSGHALMLELDRAGVCVSTGSACHSGKPQPSAALVAMGVSEAEALASLRISFGLTNTADEVDRLLATLETVVASLRARAEVPV